MLSLAIGTTLIGFALLVVGLITGQVALAIACIVVCLIGVGLLVADVLRSGRAAKAGLASDKSATDVPAKGDSQPDRESTNQNPIVRRDGPKVAALSADEPIADVPASTPSVVRRAQPPIPEGDAAPISGIPQPSSQAAQLAAQTSAPAAEGTFTDYVAATSGKFESPSTTSQPAAPQPRADDADTGPVPRVESAPGFGGSGVRWESSITPARPRYDEHVRLDSASSNWSTSVPGTGSTGQRSDQHPDGSTMHPRPSVTRSRHRDASDDSNAAVASNKPKFDPLDPNWHPPPE
ncbi:hypothetical protein GOEFS_081_00140 [Gordonia effusa NBRC 100432]|uniref:Transmembrane protein n=1 Tax=Gordonia effusa NBRC 100432 TaxID=1077974 RepID=H0R2M4_9ACTN|nr:hypothetical protein [Gordonia effusa]GAB19325.1 hypothetical protein GOEFS_081_00140 [Gordonia effusa NBRC 100432]